MLYVGFVLNDAFQHVVQDNNGFPELEIKNYNHNLSYFTATSSLPLTDMISNNFNASGTPTQNVTQIYFASTTRLISSYSSSTVLASFATASTSNLTISSLTNGLLKAGATGTVSLATPGTDYLTSATAPAYPFATLSNFGTTTAATNTPFWTQGVFLSSSTKAASQFPAASTTMLSINSTTLSPFLIGDLTNGAQFSYSLGRSNSDSYLYFTGNQGGTNVGYIFGGSTNPLVGIGTSTPKATLSLYNTSSAGNPSLTSNNQGDILNITNISKTALTAGAFNAVNGNFFWLQTKSMTNSGSAYALDLNPLGGGVGVGTTTPGSKFEVQGNSFFAGRVDSTSTVSSANLGIGTSTPYGLVSIFVSPTTTASSTTLFAISSSTGNWATTTLLAFDNVGRSFWAAITNTVASLVNAIAGMFWFDATQQKFAVTTGTSTGGVKETLDGTLYTLTVQQVVRNTTDETTGLASTTTAAPTGVGTTTIPANWWVAGKTIRITGMGVYGTRSIAPGNVTIKVKYGTTVLAQGTASALITSASNNAFVFSALITCEAVVTTNCTFGTQGSFNYSTGSNLPRNSVDLLPTSGLTTSAAINAKANLDVTVTWATQDVLNIATTTEAIVSTAN